MRFSQVKQLQASAALFTLQDGAGAHTVSK